MTNIRDPHSYEHYWTSSWNKTWKKFRPVWDLNPWPLQDCCSILPTELTSQLPEFFFSGLISTTSSVVFIAARISYIRFFTAVHMYDFHISSIIISSLGWVIWIQHNDQLPVGLLAQLVECCTSTAEVMGSNTVWAWIFFRSHFNY